MNYFYPGHYKEKSSANIPQNLCSMDKITAYMFKAI